MKTYLFTLILIVPFPAAAILPALQTVVVEEGLAQVADIDESEDSIQVQAMVPAMPNQKVHHYSFSAQCERLSFQLKSVDRNGVVERRAAYKKIKGKWVEISAHASLLNKNTSRSIETENQELRENQFQQLCQLRWKTPTQPSKYE